MDDAIDRLVAELAKVADELHEKLDGMPEERRTFLPKGMAKAIYRLHLLAKILEGEMDIKAGRTVSHEDAMERLRKFSHSKS